MDDQFLDNLKTVGTRFSKASDASENTDVIDFETANKRRMGRVMVSIAEKERQQQTANDLNPNHRKDLLVGFFTDVMNDVGTDKDAVIDEVMKRIGAPQNKI